jgi:hypothetical protein
VASDTALMPTDSLGRRVLVPEDMIVVAAGASDLDTMGIVARCAPAGTGVSIHPRSTPGEVESSSWRYRERMRR